MSIADPPDNAGPGTIRWGRGHVHHGRIPDWVLDAEIADRAVRLYVVLGRYADENGSTRISKAKLVKRLRCARSTLDVALADLVKVNAVEVIDHARGDDGRAANEYVLHWAPPANSRATPSGLSGGGPSGESVGHAGAPMKEPHESLLSIEGANAPGVAVDLSAPEGPPKLVKVDGRNLGLDAICDEIGIEPGSPRIQQAIVALNGRKNEAGIRALFWVECRRTAEERGIEERLAVLHSEPEKFEALLADRVRHKVRLLRERQPWRSTLTPSVLREFWLDIEAVAAPPAGGYTSEQIRQLRETAA